MIKSQISYDSRILNCRFLCKTRREFARGTIERGLKELRGRSLSFCPLLADIVAKVFFGCIGRTKADGGSKQFNCKLESWTMTGGNPG
jgi:hypothetical protein